MSAPNLPVLLGLAFSAGSATFFAPCAFPLIPGYVSYFLGETVAETPARGRSDGRRRGVQRFARPLLRGLSIGGAAAVGIVLVYAGLASTAVALGAGALADIAVMELVVGAVFLVTGTAMAAGWTPSRQLVRLPERKRSLLGFFTFGALYAIAAAGCTAPLFIAVVLKGMTLGPLHGVGIAVAYAAGTGAVMVALTGAVAVSGTSVVRWLSGRTRQIHRVAGGLLAVSGVAEMYYYFYGFPEVIVV